MKHGLKRACQRHLTDTFGLQQYRPGQKAAVQALLSGRDVLCILPTGAGKSLCWQLPAVVHPGLTLVVSPLIALMHDQVQHLTAVGVPAVSLDSLQSPEAHADAIARIRQGSVRILFVSPERLIQPRFRRLCQEIAPWLVVVDEAHCVLQWGESFRPAYREIAGFLHALPGRPVLCALTATADEAMQRALASALNLCRPKRILLPILRENLVYEVRTTLDSTGEILRLLQCEPAKTVIFCRSRARSEQLAALLAASGIRAEHYHAGMERAARIAAQNRFMGGMTDALCATTAFGLGVDVPDIRRIVHDYLPDSLIDYVQQSGRAGRDGQRAHCLLLLEPNDLVAKSAIARKVRTSLRWHPIRRWRTLRKKGRNLQKLLTVILTESCIPAGIAAAFGTRTPSCGQCSVCTKGPLRKRVPPLIRMQDWQIRAWLLMWQRSALAEKQGCPPQKLLPDHALRTAARSFAFPAEYAAHPEMNRLLQHFRRESMHDSAGSWIP